MLPYFVVLLGATTLMAMSRAASAAVTRRSATRAPSLQADGRSPWNLFDLAVVALLVAFAGSRVGVGTDYELYEFFWQRTRPDDLDLTLATTDQDAGFAVLQFYLKQVSADSQWFFWATAALTVVPVFFVIKRASKSPVLAVALYIALGSYLLPLNVVRQGLAASILFVAVVYCIDNHKWRYLALSALAAAMHASALPVALLLFVVRNWRPRTEDGGTRHRRRGRFRGCRSGAPGLHPSRHRPQSAL